MQSYVGLDVSLKRTYWICVVDQTGKVLLKGMANSSPEAIAEFVKLKAAVQSTWPGDGSDVDVAVDQNQASPGLPVICIDARHAEAVLKMQINKSRMAVVPGDRADNPGVAGTRRFASKGSMESANACASGEPRPPGQDETRSREPNGWTL